MLPIAPSTGRTHDVATDRALAFAPRSRTSRILVLDGTVWITQAGDVRDHVLRRGEAVILRGGGLVLALALSSRGARIAIEGVVPCDGAVGV